MITHCFCARTLPLDDRDNHEVSCAHGLTVMCSCAASKLFLLVDLAKTVGTSSSGKTVLE